ncbi:MAG: phosphatase PAP2 family protein [Chloroflexota bacterium]
MASVRSRYQRAVPYILAVYLVVVVLAFLYFNLRLQPEDVAAVLFIAAILSGRALLFIRDWGVFIAVLLAWQATSFLATNFGFPWHLAAPIAADKLMFGGTVPAVWLQAHLYHPGVIEPWDVFAVVMYMLHFVAPLLAGFLLWMTNRKLFHRYAVAFVLVALGGFITYILYPAVPPWMAAEPLIHAHGIYWQSPHGHVYLHGVQNLFNVVMSHWYNPYNNSINGSIHLGIIHMHYDKVAAIPSEHAMYPTLFFLFLRRQFGRWAYIALAYLGGLIFSILYLGQHYMVDAVIGILYAVTGYLVVMHLAPAVHRWWMGRISRRAVAVEPEPNTLVASSLEEA